MKKGKAGSSKRCATGIPGFDDLIQGGFPTNSSILVCGGPGTGKSIFCMEFLVNGSKMNEKGLYVTFEQTAEALKGQAKQFGWDLDKLEKSGKLKILSVPLDKITEKTIKEIKEIVNKEGIRRLVIDSLSTLIVNAPIYTSSSELSVKDVLGENVTFSPPIVGDYVVKRFIYSFIDQLRELDCTHLLISEASQNGDYISRDTLSEFVCDGVVFISLQEILNMRRIQIKKLRQTKHDFTIHELELNKDGIKIISHDK